MNCPLPFPSSSCLETRWTFLHTRFRESVLAKLSFLICPRPGFPLLQPSIASFEAKSSQLFWMFHRDKWDTKPPPLFSPKNVARLSIVSYSKMRHFVCKCRLCWLQGFGTRKTLVQALHEVPLVSQLFVFGKRL